MPKAKRQSNRVMRCVDSTNHRHRRRRRSAIEKDQINRALAEPVIVVSSPIFKKRNAEKLVFEIPTNVPRLPVSWYCPAIDRADPPKRNVVRLLSREEEAILFRQYNYARMKWSNLQDCISKTNSPQDADLDELVRWYDISIDRRDHIVECNLALVLAMAKRSWATGEYADLVAEGNVALLRSVDRFNCELGFKFSTYACRALTTAFNRFGKRQLKHKDNVPFEFNPDREPVHVTDNEETYVSPEHVHAIREAVRSDNAQLTEVEKDVLRFRFGLFAGQNPPKLTLEKSGKLLGISKERVRQVQLRALRKIREVLEHRLPLDLLVG
ncbi:MAG TPA: sigma-70 family RNA polymerase sigma factor [Phycisphaerales bacterium]|nr:sigma-70 family RNA polymerase sigma factor [Phycisphaerales bacterium]HIB50116.1 sigma-70 family RNA polymerase sigma factor [Phycisphaerales bacterium]HIN84200.1 sigma-70 family RNA polymerase sigma factor [Phycisphaerales bacterium]HIO19859.1 sigma-70 family RNA polymerase sigma factor [Phycisphaerales bacterium]HIO52425.1 sigma-70 family RNA polymerase sigma factor [Phycisphaerales bacterium]